MSGGHFNDNGYTYYKVSQFADELQQEIENNFTEDEYGYTRNYSKEVIVYLLDQLPKLRKMSEIMKHIDYLYSGDHGEDSFMDRVIEVEETYD